MNTKGYNIFLTEKENLILSACTTIAAISFRIPEIFNTVQLDTRKHPADASAHYAKAMLVVTDNMPTFLSLTEKLRASLDESPMQCLCGNCQMTEQSCRHKRVGPSKPGRGDLQ